MREHVELRQRELVDPVDANGVAQSDEVEPAAAADPPGDGAVLPAELAHLLLVVSLDLRREGALADARHICLRHAEHLVEPLRADPHADRGIRGDGVRRRDERIRAVVEVEQRRLRSLALSIAMCHGMMRWALPDTKTFFVEWPRRSNSSSSAINTSGSMTQPLPITQILPRTIPVGSARILYVSSPTTIVCPALGPPW